MATPGPDLLFYDGQCGLCQGLVRFLARRGGSLAFAPLGGETFRTRLPQALRAALPDAAVLLRRGRVRVKSEAVLAALEDLGGAWAVAARLGRVLPLRLRDALYDRLARRRRRGSGTACPRPGDPVRARFLP